MAAGFHTVRCAALRVVDLADYRRADVGLALRLVARARQDDVRFHVPRSRTGWDRIAFLNLTFWTPGAGELLPERATSVDALCHVTWHHLARRHLGARSRDAALLGEAIASAFDLYLVGRLLRARRGARFLDDEVPRLAERTADAGLDHAGL